MRRLRLHPLAVIIGVASVFALLALPKTTTPQTVTAGTVFLPQVYQTGTISVICADPCDYPETANSAVVVALNGQPSISFHLDSTTGAGTGVYKFEASIDGKVYGLVTTLSGGLLTRNTSFTNPIVRDDFILNVPSGYGYVRVRATTISGTSTWAARANSLDAYSIMLPVSSWFATQIPQRGVMGANGDGTTNCGGTACTVFDGARNASPTGSEYGKLMRIVPNTSAFESNFKEAINSTTEVFAVVASTRHYITSVALTNEAATVQTVDIVYGTGANCAISTTALTPKFQMGINATTTSPFVVSVSFPTPLVPAVANAVCVRPTNATAFGAVLTSFQGS